MDKIRPSSLIFDREGSIAYADRAREVLGDILPVRMSTMLVASCDIRGATEFCTDIYEDPDYAAQLLSFVTDAMIAKIKAWRRYLGLSERADAFFFAGRFHRVAVQRHVRGTGAARCIRNWCGR